MGPLGGIASALAEPGEPWRLVLSCDLALVDAEILEELTARAASLETSNADLVAPEAADGRLQPLCGLWRQRVGPALARHLQTMQEDPGGDHRRLSVWRFTQTLHTASFRPANPEKLRNINTMRDYLAALGGHPLLDGRNQAIPDSAKRTHGGAK
jgi:molybdopterin-guanine dinucleotide biosynthesis protein A